jgi:uncharacterized membrane protein (DUF373 family)
MRTRSQYRHRTGSKTINRVLTGIASAIVMLLILLDTSVALFQLTTTAHNFPPAAWAVSPPDWVD